MSDSVDPSPVATERQLLEQRDAVVDEVTRLVKQAEIGKAREILCRLESLPIDEVRTRAGANDIAAMEEVARRLLQGLGVAKDPQAGAGWLLRAAEGGSAQAAFNLGVMY